MVPRTSSGQGPSETNGRRTPGISSRPEDHEDEEARSALEHDVRPCCAGSGSTTDRRSARCVARGEVPRLVLLLRDRR
eukprot:2441045-Heterocapsa_arctica.AAC.1